MTRLLLLLSLFASVAFGQTYVRPSKGTSFSPFTQTDAAGAGYTVATPGILTTFTGPAYDWTAFDAVRVRVYSTSSLVAASGIVCQNITTQYTVGDLGNAVKFSFLSRSGVGVYLTVKDAPTSAGPYNNTTGTNASVSLAAFIGCPIYIQVTPIPFPVPVTAATITLADGGIVVNVSSASKPTCTTVRMQTTSVGTTVTDVPADGGLASRWYIRACNSARNTGVPILTCTSDGQVPTTAATSSGDALEVGDCATYLTTTPIQCISDTASTQILTEECQ